MYNKEAAIVAKMYTDSQKYNKVSESFDFKLTIFENICRKTSLQPDNYIIVFPIMLKGLAQNYYYNCTFLARIYLKTCTYMRNFFKGLEFYKKALIEWNAIIL